MFLFYFFFFFKQKTAYEMRISDWSSDVCSSDLDRAPASDPRLSASRLTEPTHGNPGGSLPRLQRRRHAHESRLGLRRRRPGHLRRRSAGHRSRSEEHTSELQSLMRISYAVFCLKKNKIYTLIYTYCR